MKPKFRVYDKRFDCAAEVISLDFKDSIVTYKIPDLATVVNEFDDVIIMQSTGHKDKNGVEIFEGDIIHHDEKPNPFYNIPFIVERARIGEWRLENGAGSVPLLFSSPEELEVKGNIYDSPEALEV